MSNEARVLDSFGPNLVIETNGPVGVGGGFAYQLYSITCLLYTSPSPRD